MVADQNDSKPGGSESGAARDAAKREKPPVTIDLAAEKKIGEPAAKPSAAGDRQKSDAQEAVEGRAPPPPPPSSTPRVTQSPGGGERRPARTGIVAIIVAGVVGGIIATGLGIAYHASGVVPSRSENLAQDALTKIGDVTASVAALDKRIATLETTVAPLADTDLATLAKQVAALEATGNENRTRIEKLEAAPAPIAVGPGNGGDGGDGGDGGAAIAAKLGDIDGRLGKLEADGSKIASNVSAIATLRDQVTSVEGSLKDFGTRLDTLTARPDPAAEVQKAARVVAIGALQQAAAQGGPFAADLAMLKALGSNQAELAELEPLAGKDTPSVAALQQQFPAVADAVLDATADLDPEAGLLDRLGALGSSLVSVRPTTVIEGETPEAVVSRMQAAVDAGDLAKALSERDTLPEAGKTASAAWAAAAGDRVSIDDLVNKLALSMTAPGN